MGVALLMLAGCESSPRAATAGAESQQVDFALTRRWEFLVQLPPGYGEGRRTWPLVVFLHGSGERGSDVRRVAVNGYADLATNARTRGFILVAPQCPEGLWWYAPEVDAFVAAMARRYQVDPKRVYLVGLSMGGYATWDAATYHPARYAAIVPICGGGEYEPAAVGQSLREMPVWAFHGARDQNVPPENSIARVDAINAAGGHAVLTLYPEIGHDSWNAALRTAALYDWLLAQRRP